MKVALGVRKFCPVGGQEHFSMRLAEYLAAGGHEVLVYTYQGNARPDIQINTLPLPAFRPRYRRDWITGRALASALQQSGADVTYGEQKTWGAHVIRPGGGVEAQYWNYKTQRKWNGAAQCMAPFYPKRWYDLSAERNSLLTPHTRAIIANSHLIKNTLCQHYPSIANKIHVVHNGASANTLSAEQKTQWHESIRTEHGIPASALVALFAGHDFHRKGLATAIEALAMAHQHPDGHNWHLLVCGRGHPYRYQRQAIRCGIDAHIHFAGCTYACESLYAAADLLLLPSHYDPFANVTVEALAAGIPVITTTQNGASEIIEHNVNGWVVPDHTYVDQITLHLLDATQPSLLQTRKTQALASARKHLLQDRLQEIENILTQIAQRNQNGA